MSTLYEQLREGVQSLRDAYADQVNDLKKLEGWDRLRGSVAMVFRFAGAVHRLIGTVPGGTAAERKEAVMQAVADGWKDVSGKLDIPGVPEVIEERIVKPWIGSAIHYLASGIYDGYLLCLQDAGLATEPPAPESTA